MVFYTKVYYNIFKGWGKAETVLGEAIMEKNAEKAYIELERMGVPVMEKGWGGHFQISGEFMGGEDDKIWADYYMSFIDAKIVETLAKYDLHAEWYNPGLMCVYH